MKIKTLKRYWVCVAINGTVSGFSIAATKSESIEYFLQTSGYEWREAQDRFGWTCVKVNITFEEIR